MENDLISRSALKKYVNDNSTHWLNEWDTAGVLLAIERMPAVDAVEVVRCKDCVCWMYEYDDVGLCVTDVAPVDDGIDGVQRLAMDFCSYGERKADDGGSVCM